MIKYFNYFFLICIFWGCSNSKKDYYLNGNLKSESLYKDGKLNGHRKVYYENGKLKSEGNYLNDIVMGEYKKYFENGNLQIISSFVRGVQEGPYKEYYEDGKLKMEGFFVNGKENGFFKFYHSNGKLSLLSFRENDVTLSFERYNSAGLLIKQFHAVIIYPEKDTIFEKENYRAIVKYFTEKPDTSLRVSINIYNGENKAVDFRPLFEIKKHQHFQQSFFESKQLIPGNYTIRAMAATGANDTAIVDTKNFVVITNKGH